jgi:hypothetical protein
MHKPDPDALVRAVDQLIRFLSAFGDNEPSYIPSLGELVSQIKQRGPAKELLGKLEQLKDEIHLDVRGRIFEGRSPPEIDQDHTMRELEQATGAISLVLHPLVDQFLETDISDYAGSQHLKHKGAYVNGDPADLRTIVERAIEFTCRYSQTLGSGDLKAAHAMIDSGLRRTMSFGEFVKVHKDADRKFGGPALEFQIERFAFILTDSTARQKSKSSQHGWQKETPKEERRCRLIGFWLRDCAKGSGSRGSLWLSEENGEYRLANFDFYSD